MLKRTCTWLLSLTLIMSMFSCFAGVSSSAATVNAETVAATTASQDNMVLRADAVYGCTWTAAATISGWRGNYTYTKGNTYRLPYGQPVYSGKFIGTSISIEDFLSATTDASNIFYSGKSDNGSAKSTYYAIDCSAFVSYCWGISRHTTATLPSVATSYGLANSSNVDKIKVGDALNYSGSHVVLVTDVTYSGSTVSSVEITEQTPPEIKRTTYTRSGLVSKYGNSYTILRYSGSVAAPTFKLKFDANGGSGSMSKQTINYGVSTKISANTFTRAGYKFAGWNAYRPSTKLWYYTDGTNNGWYKKGSQPSGYTLKVYKDEAKVSKVGYGVEDTVEMKAVWEESPTTFTLTFNANGGTGTMKDQEIEYGVSTSIRKNKFTNEGYDFYGWTTCRTANSTWRYTNGTENGWYKKGKQPDGYYLAIYKDEQNISKTGLGTGDIVEMHAVWGSANYKVKYNANGGSGTMSNSSHVYGVQKALSANAFTKSDSTFAGWYMTRKSDGKTLYAMGDTQKWCIPGNQPDGYTLQLFNDQKVISKLSSVEGDVVTCTAQWTPKSTGTTTFYIDYNANGGTGTMERTTVVKGESTATTKCTFVRPGYKMTGWRAYRRSDDTWRVVGPDGTVKWCKYEDMPEGYEFKLYKNGGSLSGTSSVDCDIVTFFAEWEKDIVPGDTDLDGIVDINDATRIQKYLADLVDLSKEELEAADFNGDGVVNVDDVTDIQVMLAQ